MLLVMVLAGAGAAGCATLGRETGPTRPILARFFSETTDQPTTNVILPVSGVRLTVGDRPVFTEADIVGVELVQVELGKCLLFQFTPAAARDLYRFSASHQGSRLVLMLNSVPAGARRIDAPLADGALYMFVELPDAELPELVDNLKKTTIQVQRALARKS